MPTTLANAIEAVRERLDELDASQWTDKSLRRWMNEAARNIARESHIFIGSDTIPVVVGTSQYALPSNILRVKHVYFTPSGDTDRFVPLEPRSWHAMDPVWGDRQNNWTGHSAAFYTITGYSPNALIKLWPVPSTAGTLTLYSARLPAELNIETGGGNIDIPDGWEDVMYEYVEYMALRKDRDPRYQQAYEMYIQKLGSLIEMGEQLDAPNEFIPTPISGYVPAWLADPNW